MSLSERRSENPRTSRRAFIKNSSLIMAGGAVGGGLGLAGAVHAEGTDLIKIGLVGCGARGTEAAVQALNTTSGPLQLVAMADAFPDKIQSAYRAIKSRHGDRVDVPHERRFSGLDAYRRVLESDADVVILATPPGFRPVHFEAAVAAEKHVYAEPPLATDPAGVQRVMLANEAAKKKGLAVSVGLHRRHDEVCQETIARLQDGAIGHILLARTYWNGSTRPFLPRRPRESELDFQLRNWSHFTWLGGDSIVQQSVHNLDVINWLLNDHPIQANGQGTRHAREDAEHGQVYDQHFVEFTYRDGTKLFSQCRRLPGCWRSVSEFATGTDGHADIRGAKLYDASGVMLWNGHATRAAATLKKRRGRRKGRGNQSGQQQQQDDLFAALRRGERPNECDQGVESTMTAIVGRMATYSGQLIDWDSDAVSEPL